jgi:hypothetical protein
MPRDKSTTNLARLLSVRRTENRNSFEAARSHTENRNSCLQGYGMEMDGAAIVM